MCIITICFIFILSVHLNYFVCACAASCIRACMDELYLTGLNPPPQDDSFPLSLATDRGD